MDKAKQTSRQSQSALAHPQPAFLVNSKRPQRASASRQDSEMPPSATEQAWNSNERLANAQGQNQEDRFSQKGQRDLGSRWSADEIEVFFENFVQYGTDWAAIVDALHSEEFSHRTMDHVIAFYEQNRSLLSQAELTDDDMEQLKASMKQFYKMKNKQRVVDRVEPADRNQINYSQLEGEQPSSSFHIQQKQNQKLNLGEFGQPFSLGPQLSKQREEEEPKSSEIFEDHHMQDEQSPESTNPIGQNKVSLQRDQPRSSQVDSRTPPARPSRKGTPQKRAPQGQESPEQSAVAAEDHFLDSPVRRRDPVPVVSNRTERSRKPTLLSNRKGLPAAFTQSQVIADEEFLLTSDPSSQVACQLRSKQIESPKVQLWFNSEFFYSQMDRVYFAQENFLSELEGLGLSHASLSTKEWAILRKGILLHREQSQQGGTLSIAELLRKSKNRRRRLLFSPRFIEEEMQKLEEFRSIFRELIFILNQHKELLKFIFMDGDGSQQAPDHDGDVQMTDLHKEILAMKAVILKNFGQKDKEKQGSLSPPELTLRQEKASRILDSLREQKVMPISVQQRVLAIHPSTGELRTAQILTSGLQPSQVGRGSKSTSSTQYRAQFDRTELGVPLILDTCLTPINNQGANWALFTQEGKFSQVMDNRSQMGGLQKAISVVSYQSEQNGYPSFQGQNGYSGSTLADEIKNQILYFKVLIDKHDKSLINVLDLSSMLNATEQQGLGSTTIVNKKNQFVKFEHTHFSQSNKKAMTLLIILLERKNLILKSLQTISDMRGQILQSQIQNQQASDHDEIDNQTRSNLLMTNLQLQEKQQAMYEWLYAQLEYTNRAIAPILTAFRYRSIKREYLDLYENQPTEASMNPAKEDG